MTKQNKPSTPERTEKDFYAGEFDTRELRDLERALDGGLENEIRMLRVVMRRFFQMTGKAEHLDEAAKALQTPGRSAVRVADLCKAQERLGRKTDVALSEINQALQEVLEELRAGL